MLYVHRSPHAEPLAAALADVLASPPTDVFDLDLVAVHSRGLERWLAQRVSHHLGTGAGPDAGDGICAAVDFPFPGNLISQALADATGVDPAGDPWTAERSSWHLLGLLADRPDLADGTPLAVHLRAVDGCDTPSGRLGAVRRVADLFDRYAVHRPQMLVRWAAGDRADPVLADGRPLPAGGAWQAGLWRELRDHLAVPSPAERLAAGADRLVADPDVTGLPSRLSLFGLTALPASYLVVLHALAVHRDVHLFLLHPSPNLWRRADRTLAARPPEAVPRREDDPLRDLARNPLLRAWGRDAREMQVVLAATQGRPDATAEVDEVAAADRDVARTADTLLARLHADVRGDVNPPGPPGPGQFDQRPQLLAGDVSVQVHACHGPDRQVEVLRDVLLHRFAADPTLEPRDVLVLCPDIERFAPLLEATFAAGDRRDGTDLQDRGRLGPADLRVRIADRALKRTNPLLRVVADLLDLADGRVSASQVLDLAARSPVRARFGFDDDDLDRIDTWVRDLSIRWGVDADHRLGHGIATAANTWRSGLDRLLVGVAVADEDQRTVGEVVPYDDVTSSDVDLAGRLAELLARLDVAIDRLAAPRDVAAWRRTIDTVVDSLTDTRDDAWQSVQLAGVLDGVESAAASGGAADDIDPTGRVGPAGSGSRVPIGLAELRSLLGDRLQGTPGRASHRTGDLIVCSLVPMRSVPHRVVCLLGMDDGAFPRRTVPDGDDLLEHGPRVGDRDPRTEDRQLLLDALLAADDQLLVTYSGRDERTNDPRPPAVPVGELLDVIDRTVTPPATVAATGTDRASEHLTVHHPLHPFDPRNFRPGDLGVVDEPLGSDAGDLAGARALLAPDRAEAATLLTSPLDPPTDPVLPPLDEDVIDLGDLVRAVLSPIPTLLADRLGLRFSGRDRIVDDELTVELDGLERWKVGTRLLDAELHRHDRSRTLALERARGSLPPGELATATIEDVDATVDTIVTLADDHGALGPAGDPIEIDVPLPDGRRIVGAIDQVLGDVVRQTTFTRLKPTDRLRSWVQLVALTAAEPTRAWRAVTVAQVRSEQKKDHRASAAVLPPLGDDATSRRDRAMHELVRLVELRDLATTRPVPIATDSSARFAESVWGLRHGGKRWARDTRARSSWEGGGPVPGERAHPALARVFGAGISFTDVLAVPADDRETGEGWDEDEPSRFGRWALRLWTPLLDHEQVEDRA